MLYRFNISFFICSSANFRSSSGSAQDTSHQSTQDTSSTSSTPAASQTTPGSGDDIPKGLATWREAVHRAGTSAQLAMCLYSLESSIAWDKSIMKAVSEQAEFSIQNARKYNSKLGVGACAFAFLSLVLFLRYSTECMPFPSGFHIL